jgi:hypothetical protein
MMTSALICIARNAAAVSVEKVGVASAGGEDDGAPDFEMPSARRRMYGSANSSMRMAVMTRVSRPLRSRTSWSARALITVPSMPM